MVSRSTSRRCWIPVVGGLVNILAEILHFFGVPAIAPHPVHQMAIARTLGTRFDGRTVARIQAQQKKVDTQQGANEQHMHAMMGEDGRTKAQTIQATDVHIAEHLTKAHGAYVNAQRALAAGDTAGAREQMDRFADELGQATHPLQDSTSPRHRGFQDWGNHITHAEAESHYPGAGTRERKELERRHQVGRGPGCFRGYRNQTDRRSRLRETPKALPRVMIRHFRSRLVLALGLSACGGEVQVQHKSVPDHGPARVELPVGTDPIDQCWEHFRDGRASIDLGDGDKPWREPYTGLLVDRKGNFRQVALGPHDAYLFDGGGYQGRSSEYFDDDDVGLPFEAEYMVRVESLGLTSTRVSVEAREYRIRVGSRTVITHAGREEIKKRVAPSRWDEYRVILCLAACLRVDKPLLATLTPPHIDPKSDWLKSCRGFEFPAP